MKQLLFLALCVSFFCSCQKEIETDFTENSSTTPPATSQPGTPTPVSTGTITVKIDGKTTTFNTMAMARKTTVAGFSAVSILGFQGTAGTSDQISVNIFSSNPVVGTYLYDDPTGATNSSLGLSKSGGLVVFASMPSITNSTKITISAISQTAISGTFNGEIVQFDLITGQLNAKLQFTDGQFNVKFN